MSSDDTRASPRATATNDTPPDLVARVIAEGARHNLFSEQFEPVRLGRYTVLGQLGRGAMGVVFAAYDPSLERKVAIKLVHSHRAATRLARERMRREAKAMARASHANVVHVYEAGEHDGHVFIAMEYVEGTTLTAWLSERPRAWQEVLGMFVGVGRGLAAAHAAGVVHRDFKPDNVLVTTEGVPKVADFGVAQLQTQPTNEATEESSGAQVVSLTSPAAPIGTPLYRSPEQHRGRSVDESSDQFAFCVALYEALYHALPFAGDTTKELFRNVAEGNLRPPPTDSDVPHWLRAAVVRGLASDASERHASMQQLVDLLSVELAGTQRRWPRRMIAALVVAGGVTVALLVASRGPSPCGDGEARLREAWNDDRRAGVERSLSSVDVAYAAETADRVLETLDAYGDGWAAAYREACEATRVHGGQSEALLDRRMSCLDKRRRALGALVEVLEEVDRESLPRATSAALALPAIDRCSDLEYVEALVPPPEDPEVRRRATELEESLDHANAMQIAGRYAEALPLVTDVASEAAALELDALVALAQYMIGRHHVDHLDVARARTAFEAAYHAADAASDDEQRVQAAAMLLFALSRDEPSSERTRIWEAHAMAAWRRAGSDPNLEMTLYASIGTLRRSEGRFEDALAAHRRALEVEKAFGGRAFRLAPLNNEIGLDLQQLKREAEALEAFRETQRLLEDAFGADHPRSGLARGNVASSLRQLGRFEESLELQESALRTLEGAFGPEHENVIKTRGNIGLLLVDLGRYGEALPILRRVANDLAAIVGPDNPVMADAHRHLALVLSELGEHAAVEAELAESLRILEQVHGSESPFVADVRLQVGQACSDRGAEQEALRHYRDAARVFAAHAGESSPQYALAQSFIALSEARRLVDR
jgi:tRNA A-37 threonylcarbamoyl transferase component Bud32/tetratricopeptide (TPR) repeat protein